MKRIMMLFVIIIGSGLLSSCTTLNGQKKEIKKTISSYLSTINQENWEGAKEFLADSVKLINNVSGKARTYSKDDFIKLIQKQRKKRLETRQKRNMPKVISRERKISSINIIYVTPGEASTKISQNLTIHLSNGKKITFNRALRVKLIKKKRWLINKIVVETRERTQ